MSTIIVTTPHSLCYHEILERHCDLVSHTAATRLLLQLDRNGNVEYFPATHPRFEIDLNREISRDTDYRNKIDSVLPQARLLVDVHSFPSGAFDSLDLAVLDTEPGTWYGRGLFEFLKQNDISVGYYYGSLINDIVLEARRKGVPAILIEYGEHLNLDQIDRINRIINAFIIYSFE